MKNERLIRALEGTLILVVGILIAIFGIQSVVNIYFGILFLVAGVLLLGVELVKLVKSRKLTFTGLFTGIASTAIGTCLLTGYLSFAALVNVVVIAVIAFGLALTIYGIYTAIRINKAYGAGQIVIGFLAALMGILYITVPQFSTAFWIVTGILIAIYGAIMLIFAIANKKM